MKRTIAAMALLLALVCPSFAREHTYPMRVQVIRSRWHGRRGWANGYGHGNLFAQQPGKPPKQGMDFEFSCSNPIRHTFAPDFYPARYGKNQYEIVVLVPVLGTDKGSECTMKVQMKDYIYQGRGPNLFTIPLAGGPETPVQEDPGPN